MNYQHVFLHRYFITIFQKTNDKKANMEMDM